MRFFAYAVALVATVNAISVVNEAAPTPPPAAPAKQDAPKPADPPKKDAPKPADPSKQAPKKEDEKKPAGPT